VEVTFPAGPAEDGVARVKRTVFVVKICFMPGQCCRLGSIEVASAMKNETQEISFQVLKSFVAVPFLIPSRFAN
jgi:succinyl-CoA synthetase alpha subunit